MNIFILYFFTLFCFTQTQQQMHQRINHRRPSENNNLTEFSLLKKSKMSYRDVIIKMLKQRKNSCQFGRIRPLQLFAPKAKALPKITNINNKNNSIYDSPLKYRKRQQIRHDSNSKIFSQSSTNLRVQPLVIQKIRSSTLIDDKTGIEPIQDTNLKNQQKLRFFYTPSQTVVNQDFVFAENTPGLGCAYGLPIPIYNTPRKKCIPNNPLCGISFTCVMDVHAINERGNEIENWWISEIDNETRE